VHMAQWNLARLAETLLPVIDDDPEEAVSLATAVIKEFAETYQICWLKGMCKKIGFTEVKEGDLELVQQLLNLMQAEKVDFTLLFRSISSAACGEFEELRALFDDTSGLDEWLALWRKRSEKEPLNSDARAELMDSVNPLYIPRNHLVEAALQAAEKDSDFKPFEKLMAVLDKPFEKRDGLEEYTKAAPTDFGPYKTFCGT